MTTENEINAATPAVLSTDLLGRFTRQLIDLRKGKLEVEVKGHGVEARLEWGPSNNRQSMLGVGGNIDEALNDLEMTAFGCPAASCSSFFGDVPLKVAMIGWKPKHRSVVGIPGRIVIIPKKNDGIDWFRYFGVTDSTGACWVEWPEMTAKERLLQLYIEAWHIIARDGVSPEDVHAALMVIPEYRESLTGETFFSWTNANVHVNANVHGSRERDVNANHHKPT